MNQLLSFVIFCFVFVASFVVTGLVIRAVRRRREYKRGYQAWLTKHHFFGTYNHPFREASPKVENGQHAALADAGRVMAEFDNREDCFREDW